MKTTKLLVETKDKIIEVGVTDLTPLVPLSVYREGERFLLNGGINVGNLKTSG